MKDEGEDQVKKKKNACFWCGQEGHKAMNCKAMYGRGKRAQSRCPDRGHRKHNILRSLFLLLHVSIRLAPKLPRMGNAYK